jgi:hypothetical protein
MKDGEKEKRERKRETRNKIEIRPFQLQTIITFDRKFRLRYVMRSQKVYDEIYKINYLYYDNHFQDKKLA